MHAFAHDSESAWAALWPRYVLELQHQSFTRFPDGRSKIPASDYGWMDETDEQVEKLFEEITDFFMTDEAAKVI